MVSIGRALISNPALVLADEPTGNLDSENSKEIIDLLKMFNKTYNQTLIMISHDERIALQADRIITIKDGRIDRKSTRLNSSHVTTSYAVFCLKTKKVYVACHTLTTSNITSSTK